MLHAGRWTVVMVAATLLAAPVAARAQGEAIQTVKKAPAVSKPTPHTGEGRVDFSGVWSPDPHFIYDINGALVPGDTLPIQPWALKTTLERGSKDDPEANCLPTGVPRQAPYPWRIV